ncbi:hypothetical protein [Variovorax boronicumulans]|uniref:hypothetical protein n=1 Tax=Variovorax boronicumulans TaxID=436515 RepID=UPI00142E3A54|nr:hypothetical protein [Variovorax boronicumulans]
MDEKICFIYSRDRKHRLAIFRRPSGAFGSVEQYHFTNDEAGLDGWASFAPGTSYYADLDVAKRELVFDVSWPIGDEGFVSAADHS